MDKYLLILILWVMFASCKTQSDPDKKGELVEIKNFGNDIEAASKKENIKTDFRERENISSKIIGKWGIYTHLVGESIAYCNACPRIYFNKNGKATLTNLADQEELYNWSINREKLILNYVKGGTGSQHFENAEYRLVFSNEDDYIGLRMSLNREEQYILGKLEK